MNYSWGLTDGQILAGYHNKHRLFQWGWQLVHVRERQRERERERERETEKVVQTQVIYPPSTPPPTATCVILPTTIRLLVHWVKEEKVKLSFSHKLNPAQGDKSTGQMGFYHSADKLFVEHDTSKQQLKNEQPFQWIRLICAHGFVGLC